MIIKLLALTFIVIVTTYTIYNIKLKEARKRRLMETGKITVGTLKYILSVAYYEFKGEYGDVNSELGCEDEITYLEFNPKIARLTEELSEPSVDGVEIFFILMVSIPLFVGVLVSMILK